MVRTVKIMINVKKHLYTLHWNKKWESLSNSQVSRKVLEDIRELNESDGLYTRLQLPKET